MAPHVPEVLALWREATKIGQGTRTDLVGTTNQVREPKNSRGYTLSRLKREVLENSCAKKTGPQIEALLSLKP
jgi:hypothetical protein